MACSTTATIYRNSGMMMEGSIIGGSRDAILVEPNHGPRQEVPRDDIAEIDHPGNVHALVGGIVLAYGIGNIAVGMDECQNRTDQQAAFCVGVFTPAALGAGMLIWGLATWVGSKGSADDVSLPSMEREEPTKPVSAALPPASAVRPAPAPAAPGPAPAAPAPAAPAEPASPPADEPMVPAPAR
jgi:hypothetical protein